MSRVPFRVALSALPVLLTLGLAAPAGVSARAGCSKGPTVTPRVCYPTRISGSFSGKDPDFIWHGKVSLIGHRKQVVFQYTGRAKISWKLRHPDLSGGCRLSPAHGTLTEKAGISINRGPDHRRGWSYSGDDGFQTNTGRQYSICGKGDKESDGNAVIQSAFDVGGFSKNLRGFSGRSQGRVWKLNGTRKH